MMKRWNTKTTRATHESGNNFETVMEITAPETVCMNRVQKNVVFRNRIIVLFGIFKKAEVGRNLLLMA